MRDPAVVEVVIAEQFRGPPNSGNGGYVCGVLARELAGPARVVLRAPIALDTPLQLVRSADGVRLQDVDGHLIAEGAPGDIAELPEPPPPPSLSVARDAARRFVGHGREYHPVCFTCATVLEEGYGLRVFVGQLAGAPAGFVAGAWTPHANFGDKAGLAVTEAVWGALDCPGIVAWTEKDGGGGLLGTMTGHILRRPLVGEECIVMAWPIEASGRKRVSGTALFTGAGEMLARSRQIWIGRVAANQG